MKKTLIRAACLALILGGIALGLMRGEREARAKVPMPDAINLMYTDSAVKLVKDEKLVAVARTGPKGETQGFWGFKHTDGLYYQVSLWDWMLPNFRLGDQPATYEISATVYRVNPNTGGAPYYCWIAYSWNPNLYADWQARNDSSNWAARQNPVPPAQYYYSDFGIYFWNYWSHLNLGTQTQVQLEWVPGD